MNIGLIGLGGMGAVHYLNYQHIPGVRVAAAVGTSESDRARAQEWGIPLFGTVAELTREVSVDLLDICVPTFLHRQLALECLACGKPTLIEKPLALSLADAQAIYAAAERADAPVYVAQVAQFTRETEALRRVVREQPYGRPVDAFFERLTERPKWTQDSWLFDRRKSGLIPYDLHIHDLDLIVSLFGKPERARFTRCGTADSPVQYRFTYDYPGLTVGAEAAWFNACIPFTARWRVAFERGMLVFDGEKVIGYGADGEITPYDTEDPLKISTGINVPPTGWFLRELTHFTACAAQRRPSELTPKAQVLAVLEVLEGIADEPQG
ncbi:MAG: Gfo/Idh/MocA family oxidoreductase [Eubacteriales bacterium]|nr:Gfo/Idh/MocA family oxidoreductase [Eubacteriales bacterium]